MHKSAQPQQSRENDAFVSTTRELESHKNAASAIQCLSAYAQPVATACEIFEERSSPDFTAGLQRMQKSASNAGNVGLTALVVSRQMSDSDASPAGDYHHFRSSDGATAALHRSLDSYFPPVSKSKDLLPHYLTQYSFPDAYVPTSSSAGNTAQTLSESMNTNVDNQVELRATFAHGGLADDSVNNYGNIISGINIISFVLSFSGFLIA